MAASRREFLSAALAAGTALAVAQRAAAAAGRRGGMRILILGGTGFLGPPTVEAALARGHAVTLFNRERTERARGGMFPDVEKLYGNRDPNLPADDRRNEDGTPADPSSPVGLSSLRDRRWDVVIDNSGYYPRHARASAELLAPNVSRYIFISTISVYADHSTPGADETAALAPAEDPDREERGRMEDYGPLKALCERAVEEAMPGRAAVVRPGFIVGPGDPTDRFTYWPVRVDRGGEVLVPGAPEDGVQVIDVRDLAAWLVLLAERGTTGVFNAVGPAERMSTREMLDGCRAATTSDPTLTWADWKFIGREAADVAFPIVVPPAGEYAGFARRSNARALAAGLTFRPIAETASATLEWFKALPGERRAQLRTGPRPEREAALLAAWHAHSER